MRKSQLNLASQSVFFLAIAYRTLKIQGLGGVWARDFAMPVQRSNQLSYEATDVGKWSFLGPNDPVMNESTNEMIYEMNPTLNCGYEINWSMILAVMNAILAISQYKKYHNILCLSLQDFT